MPNLKAVVPVLLLTLLPLVSGAKEAPAGMTQERLHELISEIATDVTMEGSMVGFVYDDVKLLCISDADADRMRIISAITNVSDLSGEEVFYALAANFHSALDARYAISDGLVYAAYIHPLSPLTETQLRDAVRQVATAQKTFGTTYTSGELYFPGDTNL